MRIVIALGGNALGLTPQEQKENAILTAKYIAPIIKAGHEVILTHGNGPQVGLINLAFEEGKNVNSKVYEMPFAECGAMSQGYIAYHLANALKNEFNQDGINKEVLPIVTHVLVDKNDPAFLNPTKPIGSFYTREEALSLPFPTKEDSGRGYRRVIASPKPVRIIEEAGIKSLINAGFIVISCGGGGIPVVNEDNKLIGIDAVIDKDFASSKLASDIDADMLLILTAVKCAKINFNKENEKDLKEISKEDMEAYLNNNEFKEGSMKPKVIASLNFLNSNKKRTAAITDIIHANDAVNFKEGTIIKNY